MNRLQLGGLEPDNLLAFLALIGILRAVQAARPNWQVRTVWAGPPWRASLLVRRERHRPRRQQP